MLKPIYIITGPPAAGKSTIGATLLQRYEFGLHIPVDDLREWVIAGMAGPVGWTDETTRQFRLAEDSACQTACIYNDAGFAVVIDHCAGPNSLNDMIGRWVEGRDVRRLAITPELEINQERNQTRTGKNFDPKILRGTIDRLNPLYRSDHEDLKGWIRVDNSLETVEETVSRIIAIS